MSSLSVMILCGRSPRHLYVANRLCESARPVAIVQETGMQWSAKKIVRTLRRGGLWRKASRLLRDRRRFRGGCRGSFLFRYAAGEACATRTAARSVEYQPS